jgi:hypothetical protein
MKSVFKKQEDIESPFPKLMIWTNNLKLEHVVLFHSPKNGTVVHSKSPECKMLGKHSDGFLMEEFVDFNGSVELSN